MMRRFPRHTALQGPGILLWAAALLCGPGSFGQSALTAGTVQNPGSRIEYIRSAGPYVYLDESDYLWRYDPAKGVTLRMDTVDPDLSSGVSLPFDVAIDEVLYFNAFTPETGYELWRTNGTASGTYLIQDLNGTPLDSDPRHFAQLRETLLFLADDGVHGPEFWSTDGQRGNGVLLHDVNPLGVGDNSQGKPIVFDDFALFRGVSDSTHGRGEIWRTDGTPKGTYCAVRGEVHFGVFMVRQ